MSFVLEGASSLHMAIHKPLLGPGASMPSLAFLSQLQL